MAIAPASSTPTGRTGRVAPSEGIARRVGGDGAGAGAAGVAGLVRGPVADGVDPDDGTAGPGDGVVAPDERAADPADAVGASASRVSAGSVSRDGEESPSVTP
ncbi:hypothetical protein N5P18_08105 [Janibacter terrae]|uniref:Uncharacterized protein n=1 Tax=Janibacter terrae TaxID=103817 RepID=A0ABZ2FI22_9MICO